MRPAGATTAVRPTRAGRQQQVYSKRGRRLPGEQAVPTTRRPSRPAASTGTCCAPGRTSTPGTGWAAALVVPLRLAAPGPDRGDRRAVRRTAGPLAAPSGDDPALPDPDVGRGARAQRREPAARLAGWAVLRRLHGRRAAAAAGPVDGREGGLPRRPGADRRMVDRAVERAAPLLRRVFPDAVDAELVALDSEVEHLDQVIGSPGLDGPPVTAEEMSWLMHRSCSLGLPAPRNMPAVPAPRGSPRTWPASPTRPTSTPSPTPRRSPCAAVPGPTPVSKRHVTRAHRRPDARPADPRGRRPLGAALGPPPASVEWSARIYVRRPEEVGGELRPADEQGPLPGPALHRRARAGTAAVAVPAGRPGCWRSTTR